jgi:hypothetical protein
VIRLKRILNEIGEGVTPFQWKRTGVTKVGSWMADMSMADSEPVTGKWTQLPSIVYTFKGDKASYIVKIAGGYQKKLNISFGRKPSAPKPADFGLIIVVSFDILDKEGSNDEPEITNFGEQYKVISTVVDIMDSAIKEISEIKWIELDEIRLAPKLEAEDEGKPITQSKRGRLYLQYIKKHANKLPGTWTAEIDKEMFRLRPGKISSTNPDRFIGL